MFIYVFLKTLNQRMSGIGLPSTTTAKRGVSPEQTSKSSMIVSNVGGALDGDANVQYQVTTVRISDRQTDRQIYCLPAISTLKVQLSLPCLLEAINTISPMSALFTLSSFSVCWSSSGIVISYRPGLLARTTPLLV